MTNFIDNHLGQNHNQPTLTKELNINLINPGI